MSKQASLRGSLLLVVTLAVGAAIVWGVVVGWMYGLVSQFWPSESKYRSIVVQLDGTPLLETRLGLYQSQYLHETLDGKPVDVDRSRLWTLQGAYLSGPPRPSPFYVRPAWHQRLASFQDGQQPPTFWYFVDDGNLDGRGYFVGYDSQTKSLVGYLTPQGFSDAEPDGDACFPLDGRTASSRHFATGYYYFAPGEEPYYYGRTRAKGYIPGWIQYLVTTDGLFRVDLQHRSVKKVVEEEGLLAAGVFEITVPPSGGQPPAGRPPTRELVAVRTSEQVRFVDPEGSPPVSFVLPKELDKAEFTFYRTADDEALAVVSSYRKRDGARQWHLCWFTRGGKVTRKKDLSFPIESRSIKELDSSAAGLSVPVPAGWAVGTLAVNPLSLMEAGEASGYPDALAWSLSQSWPGLLAVIVLTASALWPCVRRQREYAARWTALWVTLILLFGPAVLLAYLARQAWAARPACPACHRPAPRDREACVACGKPFPGPAPKGIEVFAS